MSVVRQMSVPCSKCGARTGQPCTSRRGRPVPWPQVHDVRLEAVEKEEAMPSGPDYVVVYQDDAGEFRWTKRDGGNHHRTGASEEGYTRLSYAIDRAREENPGLEVRVVTEGEDED